MTITGTYVTRAGERTRRRLAASLREAKRLDAVTSGKRQSREDTYRRQALEGAVQGAEAELVTIRAGAARLEADIATMREGAAASGKVNPRLSVALVGLAEQPALVKGAEQRVVDARARLDAELVAQAERAGAIEIHEPEHQATPAAPTRKAR